MKLATAAQAVIALALPLLAAAPAAANVITLDFETAPSFDSISTLYASQGVRFGLDALGLQNDAVGSYFSNAPSPLGVMTAVGTAATMNVDSGFIALSFFYSSDTALSGAVDIWSGLDGTGTRLASLSLANNAQRGCAGTAFCRFDELSTVLGARAYSVSFGNAAYIAAFDNMRVTVVPEPATALLAVLGLAGVVLSRRR